MPLLKKLIILLICSAFSLIINAQTLYVKNTTSTYNLDVTNIKKHPGACSSGSTCAMTNISAVPPGGSGTGTYPTGCASTPDITMTVTMSSYSATISYCGTSIINASTGLSGGELYDLYPSGTGTEMILWFHY